MRILQMQPDETIKASLGSSRAKNLEACRSWRLSNTIDKGFAIEVGI